MDNFLGTSIQHSEMQIILLEKEIDEKQVKFTVCSVIVLSNNKK